MKVKMLWALCTGRLMIFISAKSNEEWRKSVKNFVYVLTWNTSFTVSIFTGLAFAELYYVHVSSTGFYQNE